MSLRKKTNITPEGEMLRFATRVLRDIEAEKSLDQCVADGWMRWRARTALKEIARMRRRRKSSRDSRHES
jgi:hypothetical protein